MDKAAVQEKWNLWLITILMKLPVFAIALAFMVYGDRLAKLPLAFNYVTYFAAILGLIVLVLPARWNGSLSYREMGKRLVRKSDGASVALALLPMVLWVAANAFLNLQAGRPIGFYLPTWLFVPSEFQLQRFLAAFITVPSMLLGLLLIANASTYSDRVKFILILAAISLFIRLVQFGAAMLTVKDLPGLQMVQYFSPVSDIVLELGKALVLIGLLQRGKSSVKAVAIFLGAYWVSQFFAMLGRVEPMAIGLCGGGLIIWIVNYLQQANEVNLLVPEDQGTEMLTS